MWPFRPRIHMRTMSENDLVTVLVTLKRDLKQLQEDHALLEAKYLKLRGQVFAKWGKNGEEKGSESTAIVADTAKMSREELKRYLVTSGRFIPGRPAVHNE